MNTTAFSLLEAALTYIVHAGWQAAVLGVAVLVVCRLLGRSLQPRWRFALWLVVFTRLALPIVPASPWSLFRLGIFARGEPAVEVPANGPLQDREIQPPANPPVQPMPNFSSPAVEAPPQPLDEEVPPAVGGPEPTLSARACLALVWFAGVLLLAGHRSWLAIRLARQRRSWRQVSDLRILRVFEVCRQELGLVWPVEVLLAPGLAGPATGGLWRPCIVLPAKLVSSFSNEELRLVLLHELLHVRRLDVPSDRLAALLAIVHWFNPIAWLALACLRRERELACDAAVLDLVDRDEARRYGHLILKSAEQLRIPTPLPGAVEMFGPDLSLVRRIHMIASHRKPTRTRRTLGSILVILLIAVGLTDARIANRARSEPSTKTQPAEIERLIKQLGSESFAEREAASKALNAIGEPALESLRKAASGDDLEVRWRAKLVVAAIEARLYRELNCFRGHTGSVFSVAFSPDGKQLLSGSHDMTVRLWDVQMGKELRRLESHRDLIYAVAFSPDGRRVLSGSADNTMRLCDVKTGSELRCFKGHASIVYAVAFSPDGKRVASAGHDKTVRLWDVETGKELHRFEGHPFYAFNSVAFSPDGERIVAGSGDASVRLWDVETGEELRCFRGHGAAVYGVAFSADGKRILSGSGGPDRSPPHKGSPDRTMRLWDVQSGKELRRFEGHSDLAFGVALSPDGRRAVSASFDGTIRLWDIERGRQSWCFTGHRGWVTAVAFSPDGKQLVSSGKDKTVRLWLLPK